MALMYRMKKPNGGYITVNEKYMEKYEERGYINTGELGGASGADLVYYNEVKRNTNPTTENDGVTNNLLDPKNLDIDKIIKIGVFIMLIGLIKGD